jgi:integrase
MSRKRRGRGEGGVYQRADGQWVGSVSLGYNAAGKRKRLVAYGASKSEAQTNLRRLQNDAAAGVDVKAARLTLGDWLQRWLALVKPTVEPNTYAPYERHVRLHITPHVGRILLGKLAAVHVQGMYAELTEASVSAALQRKIGTTLTIALNLAVKLDMIPSNAATKIRKPKAVKPEVEVFDPDQLSHFLTAARTDRLYSYYLTAVDSGARPGELFALTWEDVDFDGGFLSITKSLEEIKESRQNNLPKLAL